MAGRHPNKLLTYLLTYLCQVVYVDFGNKEVVPKTELRVLDAEFMSDAAQCYCCRLYDLSPVHFLCFFFLFKVFIVVICLQQGGKPGILRDFSEHGKQDNSVQPQGKIVTNKVFLVCHSNICVKQLLTG